MAREEILIDTRIEEERLAQLRKRRDELKLELLESERELTDAVRKREDAGVALYNTQSQLAQNQELIKNLDEQCSNARKEREEMEAKATAAKEKAAQSEKERKEMEKMASIKEEEARHLRSLNRSLREKYDEVQREVEITKRQDSKMKDTTKALEKGRVKQNTYVDELQEQLHSLERRHEMIKTQLGELHAQSGQVKEYIKETNIEVEKISKEKKNLIQQWKSSLIDLKRRDEALAAAQKANQETQNKIQDIRSEIADVQSQIRALEQEREDLQLKQKSLDGEKRDIEESLAQMEKREVQNAERKREIEAQIKEIEEEGERYVKEKKVVDREIKVLERRIEELARDRRDVEQKLHDFKYKGKSLDAYSESMEQMEQKLHRDLHEIEIESAKEENKIARLQVKKLTAESNIVKFDEQIAKEQAEVDEKKEELKRIENIISRNHIKIEKRTRKSDELNKKYKALVDSCGGEEPLGPLESTINKLKNEIDDRKKKIKILEDDWLRIEINANKSAERCEEIEESNAKLMAKLSVLQQKKLRLDSQVRTREAEISTLRDSIKNKQRDISLLNEYIDQYKREKAELENAVVVAEKQLVASEDTFKEEKLELESKIKEIEDNQKAKVKEIEVAEEELRSYELKLQEAEKTKKEAISSDSFHEVQGMTNEIRIMEKDIARYQKEHEKLVQDAIHAVRRREELRKKYGSSLFDKVLDEGDTEPTPMEDEENQEHEIIVEPSPKLRSPSKPSKGCAKGRATKEKPSRRKKAFGTKVNSEATSEQAKEVPDLCITGISCFSK